MIIFSAINIALCTTLFQIIATYSANTEYHSCCKSSFQGLKLKWINMSCVTWKPCFSQSVGKGHENLAKLLLANKVDVNIQSNDGVDGNEKGLWLFANGNMRGWDRWSLWILLLIILLPCPARFSHSVLAVVFVFFFQPPKYTTGKNCKFILNL